MSDQDSEDKAKISNATIAMIIALIPIALFVTTFFIKR